MRHRKRGRHLGRSSSHKKAMLRNMAASLFLTEREVDELDPNPPKTKGRIVTTVPKAKEVRALVERCITIARRSLKHEEASQQFATTAERNTSEWQDWRSSDRYREWVDARAPVVNARRRVFALLRDKEAVRICFDIVAPRFAERPGGYTRVLRLAKPRLGDAGPQAILEFVGQHDRQRAEPTRPEFAAPPEPVEETANEAANEAAASDAPTSDLEQPAASGSDTAEEQPQEKQDES